MEGIDVVLADCPGLGRVRLCECNSIHLTIGPVTVNLAPEAFAQAETLMRNAMEQLNEIAGSQKGPDVALQSFERIPSRFKH